MNDVELDRRLGVLLREAEPDPDQAFINTTLRLARIDRDIRQARQRSLRRLLAECAGAIAAASTFFLLSQAQPASPDGIIPFQSMAMAGLVMLGLWAVVSLPDASSRRRMA